MEKFNRIMERVLQTLIGLLLTLLFVGLMAAWVQFSLTH